MSEYTELLMGASKDDPAPATVVVSSDVLALVGVLAAFLDRADAAPQPRGSLRTAMLEALKVVEATEFSTPIVGVLRHLIEYLPPTPPDGGSFLRIVRDGVKARAA